MRTGYRIAADIGGTFTDVALVTQDGAIHTQKLLSTPHDYSLAVKNGIIELMKDIRISVGEISEVLHGCTVATNAILEAKGAKTALITTRGFRDVLELRRIRMPRLYDLFWTKPEPLIPRRWRFEVQERIASDGTVIQPLNKDDVQRAIEKIKAHGIQAVAVAFINSFANAEHEQLVGQMLRETLSNRFICLSSEVLPEIREYERTSTTVINAYLGPPVGSYIKSMVEQLKAAGVQGPLLVMQSGGGVLEANTVLQRPAEIVECGPAAGVIGAADLGQITGYANIITFDMGGTTAKASMVEDGRVIKTDEYEVGGGISLSSRLVKGGGYALKLPVIDVSEVGAGGGSIVWFDGAGALKVGPHSAGADPGPACYSLGGQEPTVTDANVVLGYINPESIARGSVPIDARKAFDVIRNRIAEPMKKDLYEVAFGVHTVSNANMVRAIKAVSTYRGRDPRNFVLFAFGGNGGVHASELAKGLGIKRIVIPPVAGVFSALGLLFAKIEVSRSRAFIHKISDISLEELRNLYEILEKEVMSELGKEPSEVVFSRFADVRYAGQAYELTIPVSWDQISRQGLEKIEKDFENEHHRTYGHRFPGQRKETVSLRVTGSPLPKDSQAQTGWGRKSSLIQNEVPRQTYRKAYFGPDVGLLDTPVSNTRAILAKSSCQGPMIIEEYEGTIVINPTSRAALDEWGNVVIDSTRME
jgi:N-methylhydantoinase A